VSLASTVLAWGRMVKFSHSVFALPFAFAGAALASVEAGISMRQVVWIAVAMVGVRNAAMGMNRLADHALDARNPRTSGRALPRGEIGRPAVWAVTILLSVLFVVAAFQLNPLCGWLSPAALGIVFGYSFLKRISWASHLVLGLSLAMAPVGGWLAVQGRFAAVPWVLGAGVLMWVAGFDIVYACQDAEFDRRAGLHSIPARFGPRGALRAARGLHGGALAALATVGWLADLHPVYWLGWLVIGTLLLWEHRLVRPEDLSRVGVAFFNMNGIVSVLYLLSVLVSILLPSVKSP